MVSITLALVLGQDILKEKTPVEGVAAATEAMKAVGGWRGGLSAKGTGVTEEYTAVVRAKDAVAKLGGKAELWCREHVTVIGSSGRKLSEADEGEARVAGPAVNPAMIVREALAAEPGKAWEGDEKVGDTACRVLTASATTDQKKAQMGLMFEKLRGGAEASLANRLDPAASVSNYRLWISRKDGRVRKVAWEVQPKISGAGVVGLGALAGVVNKISVTYTLTVAEFDPKPELKVPAEIEKALK